MGVSPEPTTIDLAWIRALSDRNLLGLVDVLADMRDELETGDEPSQIRIIPAALRFPQLYPAETISNTDAYGRLRWKIAGLLQQKGIISGQSVVGEGHRWEQRIAFTAVDSAVISALEAAQRELRKRPTLLQQKRRFDRKTWIALITGCIIASGGWLAVDYIFPNSTRHVIEVTLMTLVLAAIGLAIWPILQNVIGSAVWDWIKGLANK